MVSISQLIVALVLVNCIFRNLKMALVILDQSNLGRSGKGSFTEKAKIVN